MVTAAFFAIAAVLVVIGGLLAALDSALSATSRGDLEDLAEERASTALAAIARDPGAHANAVNFLRIIAETGAAVLVTLGLFLLFDAWPMTLLVGVLIMTAVSFVLVGSSPRSVGRTHAAALLRVFAPLVRGLRLILGPVAAALVWLGDRVTPARARSGSVASEEQLLSIVDEAAELEVLEENDRELIHSVFAFGESLVREVMVPRTDMFTVDADTPLTVALDRLLEAGVSRMPVIGRDSDDVLGVLYLRDIAGLQHARPGALATTAAADRARPAVFVPESMAADALLRQMQLASNHLAMVVDEYGGIAGLVTLEDLIEELVGDISDEYDREVPDVERIDDERFRVTARLAIDELGELFGLELDDEDVDSAGGLFSKALGRLAVGGDSVAVSGLVLTAERVEGRGKRLRTLVAERDRRLVDAHHHDRRDGEHS